MSKETKVNITAQDVNGTPIEVILREGQATEVFNPEQFSASGMTVQSVYKFFEIVGSKYKPAEGLEVKDRAVVVADKRSGLIDLMVNPEDPLAPEISGQMKTNPDVDGLKINANTKFTADELVQYLRAKPQLLVVPSGENIRSLTAKFLNMKATVSQELEKLNDDRGNITDSFVQKVASGDLPQILKIKAPIHLGCPDHEIDVQVGLEKGNRCILFYLFSSDYELAKLQERKDVVDAEIAKFVKDGICVIEKI